ncbi:putative disease resistance protein RGA4 isoform X2 [Elaeis guineensis]
MGGLGKTTLAKLIYKDEDVKKHFQPLVWVCASDEFDVAKLVKAIIASARATQCQESNMELSKVKMASGRGTEGQESNMESLQLGLREVIGGKRYLLVLDDVWNEDQVKWDELKALLGTGGEGSRIIVTARSEQVSRIMGAREAYRLDFLSENDSWELFTKRANPPQHLESIGKEIVKKCGGLPLAVKTLGSLMQSKSQKSEWLSVRNSKIWDMQVGEDGILPALRLSYSHLPSHLKQCFAFCAIFPKDYQMQKDLLIQLWMANGFIPSGGSKELEVKGHEIFNELASRSFFQDIKEVTEDDGYEGRHQPYCITTCKMHDLMHDLAQSIMGNECLSMVDPAMLEAASRKTRHLGSFQYFQSNIHKIPLNNYPNIRTLVCQATVTADSSKPRSLRALGLHGYNIRRLPISIRFLKHLRYLDLSRTRIEALPDATSTLFNLQTLKLSNCWKLRKLPEDMRNMSSLRHLYIDSCHRLKHLPAGIGQLSSLRTLTKYIVGNDDGRRIGELNSLDLGGFLELYDLGNVRDAADAKYANLSSKHNLRSLILCWDMITWDVPHCYGKNGLYNCKDVLPAKNAEEVLEALRPSVGLKLLAIWRYGGDRFPKWMMDFMLRQLVEIHLGVCTGCEHLPPLWQLPLLKFLYLFKMDSLKHICNSTIYGNASNGAVQAFPKLQRLVLHTMQSLKEWSKDEKTAQVMLVLPHLAELKIINCPNLVTIPELPSLKSLEMKGTNKQLGWVGRLTTLSSLDIELNKTSNGTESPPLAQKEISFRDFRFLENLTITASDDLAPLLKEEKTKVLSSSLHRLEFTRCNWLFSSSQQASSPLGLWKNLTSLRSLRIQYCDDLVYWPEEEFHGLNSLKTLTIRYCNNLLGPLSSSSSGDGELLPNLEELTIGYCNGLLELPKLPASLRSLRVNGCPKMAMMEGLRHATALDNLSICDCSSLTSLPLELTHLNVLTSLCLWNLFGLTCLPQGFGQLTALKSLDIDNCSNLSSLPEGMQGLTALQDLDLTFLPRLTCLPQGFGQLTALKSLDISDCSNLSYLAEGMQGLTALQYLSIRRCPQLSSLPEGLRQQLPDLQHLFVGECPILEKQYRRGGPYWYLVSRIPNIEIVSETRSNFSTLFPSFSCFRRPSTF